MVSGVCEAPEICFRGCVRVAGGGLYGCKKRSGTVVYCREKATFAERRLPKFKENCRKLPNRATQDCWWELLIGIKRARVNIGLKNLAYNMRRLVYLEGVLDRCVWKGKRRRRGPVRVRN